MVNDGLTVKDTEFIAYLKKIQNEARYVDPRLVTSSSSFMCTRMNYVFDVFIQVHSLTDEEITRLLTLVKQAKIDHCIKAILLAKMLNKIDSLENIPLRQSVIEKAVELGICKRSTACTTMDKPIESNYPPAKHQQVIDLAIALMDG
jgi:hypothetical protein